MEIVKNLLPLIGVALGWGLAEFGKAWTDRKNDRKKLNKLLFFLLELRFAITREKDIEKFIESYLSQFKKRVSERFGQEIDFDFNQLKPAMELGISQMVIDPEKIKYLDGNIDNVIVELAELYPIFAYELNGQHKIKERLTSLEGYIKNVSEQESIGSVEIPFDLNNWIRPKVASNLLTEMDNNMHRLAAKIGRKAQKQARDKIKIQDESEVEGLDEFIEDYLDQIENQFGQG